MDEHGNPIGNLLIPLNKFPVLGYLDGNQFKNVIFACAQYVVCDGEYEPEGLTQIEQAFFESMRNDMDRNIWKWKERLSGSRKKRARRGRKNDWEEV